MPPPAPPTLRHLTIQDGPALWHLARASNVLDVNSPYAYLLWCRDFAATSVVAQTDSITGFVTGYVRPDDPTVFFVWQVAVAHTAQGRGIAGAMLDWLFARVQHQSAVRFLETTITDDNVASQALFGSFARRNSAAISSETLFASSNFPTDVSATHDSETLYRIGPIQPA